MPRDVDPRRADLPGVTLLDMDDLRRAPRSAGRRSKEVAAVAGIVDDEIERFLAATSAAIGRRRWSARCIAGPRPSAPAELERFRTRLDGLDDRQRAAVEALTRGLWPRSSTSRRSSSRSWPAPPRGDRLAEALRELYDLDDL